MTYAELIADLSAVTGETKAATEATLHALRERLTRAVREHDELRIPDLGTFGVAYREARAGRDPRTGAPLEIPARYVPTFRAAQSLKDAAEGL